MGTRAFVWLGGGLFTASLALCLWTFVLVMGRPGPFAGWAPIAFDTGLVTVFALHHSVFARERVKTAIAVMVPPHLVRSVFVWVASLLLILVCLGWRPIGGQLYATTGLVAVVLAVVQIAGLYLTVRGVERLDPLELAGIRPPRASHGLQVDGPYRWVRHPLYLGWFLLFFSPGQMTGDRLAFAATTTLYLVVAIPWEERSLRRSFGAAYDDYRRDVRWRMFPFIY